MIWVDIESVVVTVQPYPFISCRIVIHKLAQMLKLDYYKRYEVFDMRYTS